MATPSVHSRTLAPLAEGHSRLWPYLLALVTTLVTLALTWLILTFTPSVLAHTPFVLLFGGVFITARWGSGPAAYLAVVAEAIGALVLLPITLLPPALILGFVLISVAVTHIVTARNRAETRLHTSEAELRATWDHAAFGAALLDRDGRIGRTNPALERLLGRSSAACLGASFHIGTHADDVPAEEERFASLMAGPEAFYQREQRYVRPDGASFWGRATVSAIRTPQGQATGALMVLEDVTARHEAEARLLVSEEKLRQAQKMQAVGQLVAGVAHNFNNLLTVTTGYTELLLKRRADSPEDRDDLDQIRIATDRGAALTRQLLAFSRRQDATSQLVDLNQMIAGLRQVLTGMIREDIHLTIGLAPTPARVVIDDSDVQQAIVNLVTNARDALPSGGTIAVDVSIAPADPQTLPPGLQAASNAYVRLRVRDDGVGMSPDVQAHLFEPFFTTKEVGKGTGLSLAYVYGIVHRHNGFLVVDSAPGRGTTFNVYLPFADAPPADQDPQPSSALRT